MNHHARNLSLFLALFLTLALGGPLLAEETPNVGEVFLCSFQDGKSWDDLDTAVDVYNEAVRQAGIEPINEFVWRPLRGQVDFDFVWAAYNENMNSWGAGVSGYLGSPGGAIADAVFGAMIDCDSAMNFVELIYDSEAITAGEREPGEAYVIENYVCSFRADKTQADLQAAVDAWHAYVTELGLPMDVYRRDPFLGTHPATDVSFFAVHPDVKTFAQTTTTYTTGAGAAAVLAGFNSTLTCHSSLWTSRQVSPPAE